MMLELYHCNKAGLQGNQMYKLIQKFQAEPTDKNRAVLQIYIQRHMMAICMAAPEDIKFLRDNKFKGV